MVSTKVANRDTSAAVNHVAFPLGVAGKYSVVGKDVDGPNHAGLAAVADVYADADSVCASHGGNVIDTNPAGSIPRDDRRSLRVPSDAEHDMKLSH